MRPIDTQTQQREFAARFEQLEQSHPQWAALYETADFSSASSEDVLELLASAPNDFAAGLMYGKVSVLRSMSGAEGYRGHNFQVISTTEGLDIQHDAPRQQSTISEEAQSQSQELRAAKTADSGYSLPAA